MATSENKKQYICEKNCICLICQLGNKDDDISIGGGLLPEGQSLSLFSNRKQQAKKIMND